MTDGEKEETSAAEQTTDDAVGSDEEKDKDKTDKDGKPQKDDKDKNESADKDNKENKGEEDGNGLSALETALVIIGCVAVLGVCGAGTVVLVRLSKKRRL